MGSLNVPGSSAIDEIRNIQGFFHIHYGYNSQLSGAFYSPDGYGAVSAYGSGNSSDHVGQSQSFFDAGRVVSVGNVNRPRSLAVLACSYMGVPAL